MKGAETKLVQFLQGSDKRFVIPVYQRNYDWKIENCKMLYDDLVKVVKNNRKSHFFGSVVSVHDPDGQINEHLIIDGHQRITTISMLLLAMHNLMEKGLIKPEKRNLSEKIYEEYLVDKYQQDETRIKLKPVKNDQKAYGKLFDDATEYIPDSNLTVNYNYFYERIQKEEITVDELYDAIYKLEIISITLNQDDNPQLIFESLNSTGLALSEGDKIRNFILMGLPTKKQNEFYDKYWNRIEVCTDYDVSAFIRDYLSVKEQSTPSMNKVYFTFKNYVEDQGIEIEPLLKDLLSYARWYQILLRGNTTDKALNACIYRLNRLETTITRPFFLEVLRLQSEDKLSLDQVRDIFLTTENYLFRRTICDLPTNVLNKVFLALHREIYKYENNEDNYVNKFRYALLNKNERARFPDNDEFVEAFSTRSIYTMNSKNKLYIMERFENNGTAEDKDVYAHCDDGTYSIEHIMPQHLTPQWRAALGDEYDEIHETWLHRLANLTLTAYNSKYSNNTFQEKKTMKNGLNVSGIRMNVYIAQKDKWTLAELEARNKYLMSNALTIWPMPETDYKPVEKQMDSCSLDDDVNLSGRLIAKFSYRNLEQPVQSWVDMYERMLKLLHAEDKSILTKLAYSDDANQDLAAYFNVNPAKLRNALEIDDKLYAEKNTSTELKLSLLRRLVKLYDVSPTDIIFYLRDENAASEVPTGSRYELRKRYWTYALPFIKAAHGENGPFCYVNPTKFNWVNGFFGIGGFCISCTSNNDCAKAEITLQSSDKDRNKTAFDKLYARKAEIEKKLGVPLLWRRSDETKTSYIGYKLENVSIEKEDDWLRMAKFQAEWSKRLCDVIVPMLKEM